MSAKLPSDDAPAWRRYLRFWGSDTRADVRDEIAFHIEGVIEELRASGLSPDEARRAALRRFGDAERVAAAMNALAVQREVTVRRSEWLRGLWHDVQYGARALRRTPLATATVIATLAVGLGATTAVFAVVDQLFWRPPAAVTAPSEVRRVWVSLFERWDGATHTRPAISYPRYETLMRTLPAGARSGVYMSDTTARLGRDRRGATVRIAFANTQFFDALGVRVTEGRVFDSTENLVKAPSSVALVSARFRQRHLENDRAAVGQSIMLDGRAFTVVGILDPAFTGVDLQAVDVWAPLGDFRDDPRLKGVAPWWMNSDGRVRAVVRLPGGMDDRALVSRITQRLRLAEREQLKRGGDTTIAVAFGPIAGLRGPGETPREAAIASRLGVLGVILLLIACANVTNLLLARAAQRHREVAVRVALGVSRGRLLRLFTAESLLIAAIAGVVAGLTAWWAGGVLRTTLLPGVAWAQSTLHWRVAVFTLALAFVASWLTAIVPAMQAARTDPTEALKSGGRTQTAGRSPLRFILTSAQLALSMALLVAAAAFVTSLRRVRSLDLGFDTRRTVVVAPQFDDRESAPRDEVIAAQLDEIAAVARRLPGVEHVATSVIRPLNGSWAFIGYFSGSDSLRSIKNSDDWPAGFIVSPEFFAATGIRFVKGRTFDSQAAPGSTGIIVNETMARLLWPGKEALGQCIHMEKRVNPCTTVIGVVRDARRSKVIEPPKPQYYLSIAEWAPRGWTASTVVLRVTSDRRRDVIATMRSEVTRRLPSASPLVESLDETLAPQLRPWQLGADLFTVVGVIALLVTIIGVYANIAYHVTQRTREFGVRIAFGATTMDVVRGVIRGGLRSVAVGTALGIGAAIATGRVISNLLYDVSPYDVSLLSLVAAILCGVSIVAMMLPAWRASRVDPLTALRSE